MRLALPLCLTLAALPLQAQTCGIDLAAVEARTAELEATYGIVISTVGCIAPALPAHRLICADADRPEGALWAMGRLADVAWVHAVANATGQEPDPANPPRNADMLAARDACTDQACLCEVLIQATNDALGGTSPYPQ
jgi:hypothetical protein